VNKEENQRKFSAAMEWCAERDWVFKVVTSDELRSGHRLQNIKFLLNFARHSLDPVIRSRIHAKMLEAETPLTVACLAEYVEPSNPPAAFTAIWYMAFHHELTIPVDEAPISSMSLVTLPKGEGVIQ